MLQVAVDSSGSTRRHLCAIGRRLDRCCDRYNGLAMTVMTVSPRSPIAEDRLPDFWSLVHDQCRAEGTEDELDRCIVTQDGRFRYCFSGDLAGCDEFLRWDEEVRQIVAGLLGIEDAQSVIGGGVLAAYFGLHRPHSLLRTDLGYDRLDKLSKETWAFLTNPKSPAKQPPALGFYPLALHHGAFLSLRTLVESLLTPLPPSPPTDDWTKIASHLPYGEVVERLLALAREQQAAVDRATEVGRVREEDAPYQFVREDNMWRLRFALGEVKRFRHLKGLRYIAKILLSPRQRGLLSDDITEEGEGRIRHGCHEHRDDSRHAHQSHVGDVRRERKDIRQQIEHIDQSIEAARSAGMTARSRELQQARRILLKRLEQQTTAPQRAYSDDDRSTGKVRTYLSRAQIAIARQLPGLALHLKTSIHNRGRCWYYWPTPEITWQVEL